MVGLIKNADSAVRRAGLDGLQADARSVPGVGAMSEPRQLTLRLLGEIEVVRGGRRLVLPASRKARALLAYLAATGQSHRRDRLCSMFWDTPDDPRGALRSSLYMLRAVVDAPNRRRIVAERDAVRFDSTDAEVDLLELRRVLAPGIEAVPTQELERISTWFRGEFAEGLDLSNCPDFQVWYVAEREEARRSQVLILRTLIERHAAAPEAALPHARVLVRVDSDEISAHVTLLRVLVASGRQREAEEQRGLSVKLLGEAGGSAEHELTRVWRSLTARPDPTDHMRSRPAAGSGEPFVGTSIAAGNSMGQLAASGGDMTTLRPAAPSARRAQEPADAERKHIAVLPFTNMSGDAEQECFADGITEDIITDLSQVSALFVVARNTAFTYKGKAVEIVQTAQRLNVKYVLQGSVRKAANRIRINVQLIDGATGDHLWAQRFDRGFADIFALQDDISKNVVATLKLKLLPEELKAITTRSTLDAKAYKFYLQARAKLQESWSTKKLLRSARKLFTRAVEADPGYARAYAGIADCDAFRWVSGDLDVSYEQMLANSGKALELAPNLAEAHASKGVALYVAGRPGEAIMAFERAIELDPWLFEPHYFYGFSCKDTGDFHSAAVHFEHAAQLQPRNYQPLTLLSEIYMALGQPAQSTEVARGALRRIEEAFGQTPDVAEVLGMGAATLVNLGDYARAEKWAKRAVLLDPESCTVRYNAACAYAIIGDLDAAQECLEFAFSWTPRARRWLSGIARHDTQLDPLRSRPDFQNLMKRLEAEAAAPR
jgi:adenylate cyclase